MPEVGVLDKFREDWVGQCIGGAWRVPTLPAVGGPGLGVEQGVTGTAALSPAACAESGHGCLTEKCSRGQQQGILSPARQLGPGGRAQVRPIGRRNLCSSPGCSAELPSPSPKH